MTEHAHLATDTEIAPMHEVAPIRCCSCTYAIAPVRRCAHVSLGAWQFLRPKEAGKRIVTVAVAGKHGTVDDSGFVAELMYSEAK